MPKEPSPFPVSRPAPFLEATSSFPLPVASPSPRVLLVTPEIAALPSDFAPHARHLSAKAGGLADVSASLLKGLQERGANAHLALPNYRRIFASDADTSFKHALAESALPDPEQRLHLAEDRSFYYRERVYGGGDGTLAALAFQREVLNTIITRVRPDLIHCHDWITGLIPAFAKRHGIPCLFTVHNIHSQRIPLDHLEDRGIDAADFWQNLYLERRPESYEESRSHNPCDLLASGIFAADHVNVVSPKFLHEILAGEHDCVPESVRSALRHKAAHGHTSGITNTPDTSYNPATDPDLERNYGPADVEEGKISNKLHFQRRLGLDLDPEAPLLFWPSRLDPVQKGCELLTDLLFRVVSDYDHLGLQIAVVADGPFHGTHPRYHSPPRPLPQGGLPRFRGEPLPARIRGRRFRAHCRRASSPAACPR